MRQLKYLERLEPFINVPIFTSAEAEKQGVPRHALAYLVKRGTLERLYPGAYRFSQYEPEVESSGKTWHWSQSAFPTESFV